MNLSNLRIGTRLGLAFGVLLVILGIVVATGSVLNSRNKDQLIQSLEVSEAKTTLVNTMKSALLEGGVAMRNIGLQSEVAEMQKEEKRVAAQSARYAAARGKLNALGLSDSEKTILASIAAIDTEIDKPFKEAMRQALAFDAGGSAKIIARRIDPLNQKAVAEMDKLVDLSQAASRKVLSDSVASDRTVMQVTLVINVVAIVFGGFFAWMIGRTITVPLRYAVKVATRVSEGDLTADISVRSRDEAGELMQALKNMNGNLLRIVTQVRSGTESINSASKDIATGNQDLSARTEQQASSLEETASSMEELTATVRQNADNARQANQLAISAADVAVRGGGVVSQVVATMADINTASRKIVDIISVIDGIAFQTNILALNAAVEAARAGEEGRGFAVVATEVRSLAQRSAAAAREIKALIGDSVQKVQTGSDLVGHAGATMHEVVESIGRVTAIMAEITAASNEQSAGIEQVNQAIAQMDQATQQNAALVEEAAAASEAMHDQSQRLSAAVSEFKLGNAVG